ncbi:MAG: DUF167 domain-containing protein [Alphaproteobacteria bacterium]|nr:DUF167 domain-containing protein [Alphaproteobacteria bacterium]
MGRGDAGDVSSRLRRTDCGLRFAVRLTPKGGRDKIDGWSAGADGRPHLKARVSAPPEAGKANAALIALLAKTLGVAKSAVAIAGGETSRLKQVDVAGDADYLRARLEVLGEAK